MHGKLYKVLEITLLDKPTEWRRWFIDQKFKEYWSNFEIVQIFYYFIMK